MTRAESGDPEIRSHGGTLIEVLQFCDLPFSDRAFLRQYDSTVKGVKACDDEVPRGD
jgi:hypothetical protein